MDPNQIIGLSVVLLFVLIVAGIPIAISLMVGSMLGLALLGGSFNNAIGVLGTTCFSAICDYQFSVVPLFVFMGSVANLGGLGKELYDISNILVARLRGGLAISTVLANAVFAAITGVSIASAAVFSKISLPQMLRFGYNRGLALGTVAGSSVLGMLIPPSILLIVYGILSEQAIGRLFIAGIIPGILLAGVYAIGITLMVTFRPKLAGEGRYQQSLTMRQKLSLISSGWGVIVLVIVVLGGIYMGIFTPTEAGAAGAFIALIIVFARRRMNASTFREALMDTGFTTTSIFFLLIAAQMYSRMLGVSGIVTALGQFVTSLSVNPLVIVLLFIMVFVVLGTILDSTSILLVTMPLMIPIAQELGLNLIWFGIISVVGIEMGLLTPPLGMVVYAMKGALGEETTIEEIFRGSMPFLGMMAVALAILVFFPSISTWLPSMM